MIGSDKLETRSDLLLLCDITKLSKLRSSLNLRCKIKKKNERSHRKSISTAFRGFLSKDENPNNITAIK